MAEGDLGELVQRLDELPAAPLEHADVLEARALRDLERWRCVEAATRESCTMAWREVRELLHIYGVQGLPLVMAPPHDIPKEVEIRLHAGGSVPGYVVLAGAWDPEWGGGSYPLAAPTLHQAVERVRPHVEAGLQQLIALYRALLLFSAALRADRP